MHTERNVCVGGRVNYAAASVRVKMSPKTFHLDRAHYVCTRRIHDYT